MSRAHGSIGPQLCLGRSGPTCRSDAPHGKGLLVALSPPKWIRNNRHSREMLQGFFQARILDLCTQHCMRYWRRFGARAPCDFPSTYPGSPLPILHAILEAVLQLELDEIFRAPFRGFPCQCSTPCWRPFCSVSPMVFSEHLLWDFAPNMACDVAGVPSPQAPAASV